MKGIRMQGGIPLQGKVRIQGSKNAALPTLAATLLTNEVSYIQNCPRIADVHRFVHLLRELGCLVHWQEKGIRVQPGEKILVFVNTIAKLRKLRDTLKADGIEDVVCLCSKYRQEAEEFDKLDDVLVGNVLQHQVTLTTTTLYNGVDMKDRALKYIVSELWNPLVNAQILGRKRPLDEGDTCAVYLLHYPKERLEGELKKSRSISWNRSRHIENGLMIGRHGRHTCISLKQWKY